MIRAVSIGIGIILGLFIVLSETIIIYREPIQAWVQTQVNLSCVHCDAMHGLASSECKRADAIVHIAKMWSGGAFNSFLLVMLFFGIVLSQLLPKDKRTLRRCLAMGMAGPFVFFLSLRSLHSLEEVKCPAYNQSERKTVSAIE